LVRPTVFSKGPAPAFPSAIKSDIRGHALQEVNCLILSQFGFGRKWGKSASPCPTLWQITHGILGVPIDRGRLAGREPINTAAPHEGTRPLQESLRARHLLQNYDGPDKSEPSCQP
jgi:hypothetical protein